MYEISVICLSISPQSMGLPLLYTWGMDSHNHFGIPFFFLTTVLGLWFFIQQSKGWWGISDADDTGVEQDKISGKPITASNRSRALMPTRGKDCRLCFQSKKRAFTLSGTERWTAIADWSGLRNRLVSDDVFICHSLILCLFEYIFYQNRCILKKKETDIQFGFLDATSWFSDICCRRPTNPSQKS